MKLLSAWAILLLVFASSIHADENLVVHRQTLQNGVRVVYLHVAGRKEFGMFTYVPLGLANDAADRAQWSHIIEHLVIHSTIDGNFNIANAQTRMDHMRLDYYGDGEQWQDGLSHHERWLKGLPFDAKTLKREVPRANAEVDNTAGNLFSGLFAIAAWNQIYRHGREHAAIKADLENAKLEDVQAYRDQYLFVPQNTLICAIGGVDPKQVLEGIGKSIGNTQSTAKLHAKIEGLKPIDKTLTWDVPSQHLLYTWPVCGPDKPRQYAALIALNNYLASTAYADKEIAQIAGQIYTGVDLTSPEGTHFYLQATLKPNSPADKLRKRFDSLLDQLKTPQAAEKIVASASMLAASYKPELLSAYLQFAKNPAGQRDAVLNFGLVFGTYEYQFGPHRDEIVSSFAKLTKEDFAAVLKTYLQTENRTSLLLVPKK